MRTLIKIGQNFTFCQKKITDNQLLMAERINFIILFFTLLKISLTKVPDNQYCIYVPLAICAILYIAISEVVSKHNQFRVKGMLISIYLAGLVALFFLLGSVFCF
jgi:hypothetical protein